MQTMQIQVKVHGLLQAAAGDPEGRLTVTAPAGSDIAYLITLLAERSTLFDERSLLAVVDGERVPLSHALQDGQEVELFHTFSGG